MVTFEQIDKANKTLSGTDIKGKNYIEVNQRIKAFRQVYPGGSIATEIISLDGGVCVMKCTITDGENLLAVAHAYEKESSSYINKTSYIENCCTSATGRALGYCGFGIDTSIASYEEVSNAIHNQGQEAMATKEQLEAIKTRDQQRLQKYLENKKKSKAEELTEKEATYFLTKTTEVQLVDVKIG